MLRLVVKQEWDDRAVSGGQQVKEEKDLSHVDDKLFNSTHTPGKLTRSTSAPGLRRECG